jgi:hypothetical protein
MNIDEITHIARKAGFVGFDGKNKTLAKFAKLVAAHEREECAKLCEEQYEYYGHDHIFAKAIRARSNT